MIAQLIRDKNNSIRHCTRAHVREHQLSELT